MTIYLIYAAINHNIYDREIKFLIPTSSIFQKEGECMKGLYAWTNKKSIFKKFIDDRNKSNIYIYVKKDFDEDELNSLCEKFSLLKLSEYSFYNGEKDGKPQYVNVVTTKNEFIVSTEDGSENLQEDIVNIISDIPSINIFNKKISKACNIIGLTTQWYLNFGNEETIDYISYNYSFDIGSCGEVIKFKDFMVDLNILLYLFQYMFIGYSRKGIT